MKHNLIRHVAAIFIVVISMSLNMHAQEQKKEEDHSYKPLTLKLNDDGSKYLRFIMWHQIWLTSNNLSVENSKFQVTPSIRRSRILAFAQISPKFLILTHFGLNSLTPQNLTSLGNNGDSPQFFLHGAWGELKLNKSLYLGGGLHYWKGLTRLANQSTLNFLTMDQARPFVQWHSLGITDQFARHLGIYVKGSVGNFEYRMALNSPLRNTISGGRDYSNVSAGWTYTGVSVAEDDNPVGNTVFEGYVKYNFFDKESTKLPYYVGSYLGKKKVLALGTGWFIHNNGMYNTEQLEHGNVTHFAVDGFLDLPIAGGAFTAYTSFASFDYGENYVSRWAGTGTNFYVQAGYYLKSAKIQPYISYQNGNYDGTPENITSTNAGLNYFINGHHCKVSLEYHHTNEAAIVTPDNIVNTDQIRMQLQIFL